jgi:hypothetical protein
MDQIILVVVAASWVWIMWHAFHDPDIGQQLLSPSGAAFLIMCVGLTIFLLWISVGLFDVRIAGLPVPLLAFAMSGIAIFFARLDNPDD